MFFQACRIINHNLKTIHYVRDKAQRGVHYQKLTDNAEAISDHSSTMVIYNEVNTNSNISSLILTS